jgi:SpoVK/Ycf46/Vps4 family AAA+-type ATPase
MYGCDSVRNFGIKFMNGKFSPTLILRQDEIEKQFAGNGTDSSGTKGNLLGEWLTWVNDRRIICSLFLGVPGSSKSHSAYCMGGEFGRPVINYSIPGMEHEHVGMSSKHQRTAHKVLDAISDGRIWLIATANSLNGLPPELISRFQVGGIFFFDAPDDDEKLGILKLKIASYKLDPSQEIPDMTNWTGRDVDNCARKADTLGISLVEASDYIVPLLTSHKEQMDTLRQNANGRFLSASKPGVYEYKPAATKPTVKIVDPSARKMR